MAKDIRPQFVCVYADICNEGTALAPGRHAKDPCKHAIPHPREGLYGCDHMHCEPHLKSHEILNGACCLPIVDEVVCQAACKCNPGGCRHAVAHACYDQCNIECPDALRLKLPVGCKATGKKVIRMPQ